MVGFVVFVIWEMTDPHPVVDLRVFRHRGFLLWFWTGDFVGSGNYANFLR